MLEVLYHYFERSFPLTETDRALIQSVVSSRKIKKGEFLVRAGEVSRYGAFVTKGFLRSYIIDNKGKEHIMQFAPENWWISDKTGMSEGNPSTFFIDAIEDSDLILMDLAGHLTLLEKLAGYSDSFRAGIQRRAVAKDHRIISSLTASAEERYSDFLETYPNIAQRVPQHMLASYLGVTPETVSRIRKQASLKK
jgi:CRP/FNR family transcriptional regulator, anaerobic regulatory protein